MALIAVDMVGREHCKERGNMISSFDMVYTLWDKNILRLFLHKILTLWVLIRDISVRDFYMSTHSSFYGEMTEITLQIYKFLS